MKNCNPTFQNRIKYSNFQFMSFLSESFLEANQSFRRIIELEQENEHLKSIVCFYERALGLCNPFASKPGEKAESMQSQDIPWCSEASSPKLPVELKLEQAVEVKEEKIEQEMNHSKRGRSYDDDDANRNVKRRRVHDQKEPDDCIFYYIN